jgi:hypothetical protein
MGRDNGGAGAEGQPQQQAFPKGFIEPFAGLMRGSESSARNA